VKTVSFAPGRVGSLPTYLGYLFLRFPGALGPEESRALTCFDTYDRRWTRQGQVWTREGEIMTLVTPPALFPSGRAESFGLQKPQTLGRVSLLVRAVRFDGEQGFVEGQLVKFRRQTWLTLRGRDEALDPIASTLQAEGLQPLAAGGGWWVPSRGPEFLPPADWDPLKPGDAAAPALADRIQDGVRMFRQYERGVCDDVDTECLHQYRVHLRRARSLVSLGQLWAGVPEWERLKNLLKTLQISTNDLRDLDVLQLDLPGLRAQVPWGEGQHLATWEASVAAQRKAELRKVRLWLQSEEYAALIVQAAEILRGLGTMGAPWTAGELAQQAFGRAARAMQKLLRKLPEDPADEALHEVRIRAKRLRYVLDALGSLAPSGPVKTLTSALRGVQETLGRFQDRSVLLERLKSGLAGARSGKTDPLAYGLLVGVIAGEHGRLKSEARRDARTLRSKSVLRALDRLCPPDPPSVPPASSEVSDGQ